MQTPTPEQWSEIKALYLRLLEYDSDDLDAFFEQSTEDEFVKHTVSRMLSQRRVDEEPSFLDQSALAGMASQFINNPYAFRRGDKVDQYTIVEEIGRGGMGIVYKATQTNPVREVALKIIRPEVAVPALMRRFELEGELLARLNHPGIAHIYSAGTFDLADWSQPYIAMELIHGIPITKFCETNPMLVDDLLLLVASVCDAVAHAHQKGVIHRDLKPSNILVDEKGRARIIDFGIAKELTSNQIDTMHTKPNLVLGTLAYMSPEQLSAESSIPDTLTDIYALGVIAYESLSKQRFYNQESFNLVQLIRMVEQSTPEPLGQIDRCLRGGD